MKHFFKFLAVAFVAVGMVAMTGCKKEDDNPANKSFKELAPGSWVEASCTINGQTRNGDECMFYVFNADGTGDLEFCGIQGVNTFVWKIEGNQLTITQTNPDWTPQTWVCTIEEMSETRWVLSGKSVPMVSDEYNSVKVAWKKSKYKHYIDRIYD